MKKPLILSFLILGSAYGSYYKTLPKGVRTFVFRNVQTNNISSNYNNTKKESPYAYKIEATSENLDGVNDDLQVILDLLKNTNMEAFKALSLGTYEIKANAKVNVNAYGFGYGWTEKVSVYGVLPIYDAKIQMKYKRTKKNTYSKVSKILENQTNNNQAQLLGAVANSDMWDVNGETLQNITTNKLGYKEIGDWEGSGPGDMEFGLMYNLYTNPNKYGFLLTTGFIAPTGRVDDPDLMQDIGFGDGQWDLFAEFGGSYHLTSKLTLSSWARYTYQIQSKKELRAPSDSTGITADKQDFEEKLGDKITFDIDAAYQVNDWLDFSAAYVYEGQEKSKYYSENEVANEFLAQNTNSASHNIRLKTGISSITAFQKNEFILPGAINVYYQQMIEGTNTPKVNRFEVEFRMFF